MGLSCAERQSPNVLTHIAMSYFIAIVLESQEPKAEIGDHFIIVRTNQH